MTNTIGGSTSDTSLFMAVSRAAKHLNRTANWRDGIDDFLRELGLHTGSSRVWMFNVLAAEPDYYVTDYIHEWAARTEVSNIADSRFRHHRVDIVNEDLRRLYRARLNGEVLHHQRAEQRGFLLREFERQGIHSMLTIPIMVEGQWWGILGFDDCDGPKTYPPSYIAALEIAAVLLTNVILRERLEWEVDHDHLTGLYNRRALINLIEGDLKRQPECGTLIIIDIDLFKQVNDNHGHQVGDEVLKAFSHRLASNLPEQASLARFGGEEFALWYPVNGAKARYLAERLRYELLAAPVAWLSNRIPLTASFGIAEMRSGARPSPPTELFEFLFARADEALFQAKAQGRNRIVYAR